ncbi:MAG: sigma-70 family RNA polymerase sigma factor [Acidimicrobiia bacterium]|nr:sigma-70 family RNA polymerase sigma factor [Acidimicrobiia bacterium]
MEAAGSERQRFNRLFNAHYEAVSRYCHRRLSPDDANDATAEVFVVAWKKITAVPADNQALPWLYGVARNEVHRFRRTNRRRSRLRKKLDGQANHPDPSPEVVVLRHAEHAELLRALDRLRAADREILQLRAYEQLSLADIAAVLGCSVDAAKQRSARAMRRLRRIAGLSPLESPVPESRAIEQGGDG